MTTKSLGWWLMMGAAIGGAWLCAGCAYSVTAVGGKTFEQSGTLPDAMSSALRASAAHDLSCETSSVEMRRVDPDREYEVTGCGQRLRYRALTPTPTSKRLELVSRSASPAGRDVALLTSAAR